MSDNFLRIIPREPLAEEGEEGDKRIADTAERCDGDAGFRGGTVVGIGMARGSEVPQDAVDGGIGASVDRAAIPVGIDVAELDAGGVVDVEGEGGDDDADEGEKKDCVAHDISGNREQGTGNREQGTGNREQKALGAQGSARMQ
jgi:hypothetical protein